MVTAPKIKCKWLRNIDKKFPWSLIGVIISVVFFLASIYIRFFIIERPALDYKILSNIRVLDIYADVQDLEILFKKENIIKQGKNLSILTLKIENVSNVDIMNNYYDPNNPLGISVLNGIIVENPEIIDASNEYLKKNVRIDRNDSLNLITFSNTIIDRHQSFSVKILILHKSEGNPIIKPIGKIAGIGNINVVNEFKELKISFWKRLVQGSFGVHVARFLFYILILIVLYKIVNLPRYRIGVKMGTKKRKKLVYKYKKGKGIMSSPQTDFIFKAYIKHSIEILHRMQSILGDKIKLQKELNSIIKEQKEILASGGASGGFYNIHEFGPDISYPDWVLGVLYYEKLVTLKEGESYVDIKFENELNEFVSFLEMIP